MSNDDYKNSSELGMHLSPEESMEVEDMNSGDREIYYSRRMEGRNHKQAMNDVYAPWI